MTSQYLKDKKKVLEAIYLGYDEFWDIVFITELLPVRVRGLLQYFQSRNDIYKYQKKPSRYALTIKGVGKLDYWQKKQSHQKLSSSR